MDVQKDQFFKKSISLGYDYIFFPDKKVIILQNIGKNLLTYTPYMNFSMDAFQNEDLIIQSIYKKKLDIGIISSSTLNNYYYNRDYIFKNLQMLCTIFYSHFYLLSYKKSKIQTFDDLYLKPTNIGIVHSDIRSIQDFNNLWNAGIIQNELYNGKLRFKPNIIFINKFNDVETYFKNKWIDAFFYVDVFPNIFLIKFMSLWKYFKPNLVPIEFKNESLFLKQIGYLNKSELNIYQILNKNIRNNYNKKENVSQSIYTTYKYYNYLICNKSLPNEIGYWFVKTIDECLISLQKKDISKEKNKKLDFQYLLPFFEDFNRNELFNTSIIPIPMNHGAEKYAIEKGFITYNPSKSCQILAGVKECSKENIQPIEETSM